MGYMADGASRSPAGPNARAGGGLPLLSELIVVDMAVGRTNAAAKMRRQQARQSHFSQAQSVPVLACHALLKSHLQRMLGMESPKPGFHVGKASRRGHVQVTALSKQQRKKAKKGREKDRTGRPHTRSQGSGGDIFNNSHAMGFGPVHEPQKKKSRTMGKHAVANAAKRAKGPAAPSTADSAPVKKRKTKQKKQAAPGVQHGGIHKMSRRQRRKMVAAKIAATD